MLHESYFLDMFVCGIPSGHRINIRKDKHNATGLVLTVSAVSVLFLHPSLSLTSL